VKVCRRVKAKQALEVELLRRGGENIPPPHHLRDAAEGIIHHGGQMIGKDAVRAPDDEIPTVAGHEGAAGSLTSIGEGKGLLLHAEAQRGPPRQAARGGLFRRQVCTGARIHGQKIPPIGGKGGMQLRAGTEAGIG